MTPELHQITSNLAAIFAEMVKHEDKMLSIISTLSDVELPPIKTTKADLGPIVNKVHSA